MKKINGVLNSGGVFISYHEFLTHERRNPDIQVISIVPMGQYLSFDQGFIADSTLRLVFKALRSRTLHTPMGPIDLNIGRRA